MKKANKVLWRVKAQDELGLAASAISPEKAAYHSQRANKFQNFSDLPNPPDIPLDSDLPDD
ncbi:MAG: hypothetical protein JWO15_1583 [Sphingomonadales bacterium]|nr:hypothetical protein [Sphingomonadales bacterium]